MLLEVIVQIIITHTTSIVLIVMVFDIRVVHVLRAPLQQVLVDVLNEVLDVEGSSEQLRQPLQVDIEVKGYHVLGSLLDNLAPGHPSGLLGDFLVAPASLSQLVKLLSELALNGWLLVQVEGGEDFGPFLFELLLLLVLKGVPVVLALVCQLIGWLVFLVGCPVLGELDLLDIVGGDVAHALQSQLVP